MQLSKHSAHQTPNEQIISVDPEHNAATICDRLRWAQTPRVILVVHKKNRAMRDKVNLRLVQRTALYQGIELAIVARHRDVSRLAHEIGIPVFSGVHRDRPQPRWSGTSKAVYTSSDDGDIARVVLPPRLPARRSKAVTALAMTAIILTLGFGIWISVPSAEVMITPVSERVSTQVEITASPNVQSINTNLGMIPARVEEVAIGGAESLKPGSVGNVPDARATGTVVLTNRGDQPLHVPQDTIVATSAGTPIRFKTTAALDLGPRARGDVAVTAVEPGLGGNVARFAINTVDGPLAVALNVVNPASTSGGSVKKATVVTDDDKRQVEELLTRRLKLEAVRRFQDTLKEQEFVVDESITITFDAKTFDKFVDEPADLLTLTAQATARGTVVYGANANLVAAKRLESSLRSGYTLVPETVVFSPGPVLGIDQRVVRFELSASGIALPAIDTNLVASSISGMTTDEAAGWLGSQYALRRQPTVDLSPGWLSLGRLPFLAFRITVVVRP